MNILTAKEAREISIANNQKSELFERFITEVEQNARGGETTFNFNTGGKHFTAAEITEIEDKLGYNISWNSPCLWYEVSW